MSYTKNELTASVSGGRRIWQENARALKTPKGLNPLDREHRTTIQMHAMIADTVLYKF